MLSATATAPAAVTATATAPAPAPAPAPAACAATVGRLAPLLLLRVTVLILVDPGTSFYCFLQLLPLLLPLALNDDCAIPHVYLWRSGPNPCKTKATFCSEGNIYIPFWGNRVLDVDAVYIYLLYIYIYLYIHICIFVYLYLFLFRYCHELRVRRLFSAKSWLIFGFCDLIYCSCVGLYFGTYMILLQMGSNGDAYYSQLFFLCFLLLQGLLDIRLVTINHVYELWMQFFGTGRLEDLPQGLVWFFTLFYCLRQARRP